MFSPGCHGQDIGRQDRYEKRSQIRGLGLDCCCHRAPVGKTLPANIVLVHVCRNQNHIKAQTLPRPASPRVSLKVRAHLDGSTLVGLPEFFLQKEKNQLDKQLSLEKPVQAKLKMDCLC